MSQLLVYTLRNCNRLNGSLQSLSTCWIDCNDKLDWKRNMVAHMWNTNTGCGLGKHTNTTHLARERMCVFVGVRCQTAHHDPPPPPKQHTQSDYECLLLVEGWLPPGRSPGSRQAKPWPGRLFGIRSPVNRVFLHPPTFAYTHCQAHCANCRA